MPALRRDVTIIGLLALAALLSLSTSRVGLGTTGGTSSSQRAKQLQSRRLQPAASKQAVAQAAAAQAEAAQSVATQAAAALATTAPAPAAQPAQAISCPKVFIYNRSAVQQHERHLTNFGYGRRYSNTPPWLRDGEQHRLGSILLSRLLRSPRCSTDDPSKAQIFLVPLLSVLDPPPPVDLEVQKRESGIVWDTQAPSLDDQLWHVACRKMLYNDWHHELPYLNAATARRHAFVHEEFFGIFGFCLNVPQFKKQIRSSPNLAGGHGVIQTRTRCQCCQPVHS